MASRRMSGECRIVAYAEEPPTKPAHASTLPVSAIPVIDIGSLDSDSYASYREVGNAFRQAAQSIGFFYVRDHGIPEQLIEETLVLAREYRLSHRRPVENAGQRDGRFEGELHLGREFVTLVVGVRH
jgi:hypothetical protein